MEKRPGAKFSNNSASSLVLLEICLVEKICMTKFTLPEKPKVIESNNNTAIIEIDGCYPGYGNTLGNVIRRALLSSLPGAAITVVKIKGVKHEFSTIPGVLEDVIQIILNLKQVRLKFHTDEPIMMTLKAKGEKKVTARDIKGSSNVEVVNKDAYIATMTDKNAELEMELWAEKGLGYVPQEIMNREKLEVGTIAIDAIFTPIRKVSYTIEDMRVGDQTDYNKLTFAIETDGTMTPEDAFEQAIKILVNHFKALKELGSPEVKAVAAEKKPKEVKEEKKPEKEDPLKMKVEDLKFPQKIINILVANKIKTVSGIIKKSEDELKEIEGLGSKGVKEMRKVLGHLGVTLKN